MRSHGYMVETAVITAAAMMLTVVDSAFDTFVCSFAAHNSFLFSVIIPRNIPQDYYAARNIKNTFIRNCYKLHYTFGSTKLL